MLYQKILKLIQHMPWPPLIVAALLLGLAPFSPAPHIVEKATMLLNGTLVKPIDIFDLLFHLSPTILVICKLCIKPSKQS
ncbi:RND transporter [Desulfopila sp. IMCC35008]|uniref:RND transporter n=1 Tax=Desulfopila sp. IMCC35008 TaxID=2653858 RepID=UPI001F101069|nr:RND transporter [Desulfopila sp. IMCC35008]